MIRDTEPDGYRVRLLAGCLYNYGDEEKIAEICKKMIEIDPEAREKYEQYLKETASEDYEDVDWLFFWRIWLMTHVKRWLRCMITE